MLYLVVVLVLWGWVGVATAARTAYSEGAITLRLELGQASAVVLPEEVSTITTAMPKTRLLIDKDNAYVGFVLVDPEMPRNRQLITGVSGRVYLVYVEVATAGQSSDDLVYVTHKAPSQPDILTPVSVLRRLRDSKGPGPAQPLTLALPTLGDSRITLSKPRQYTIGPYQALVLTIENTQETALALDERVGEPSLEVPQTVQLQTWVWPPGRRLSAVAVEDGVLPPQGSTTLYAVFEER